MNSNSANSSFFNDLEHIAQVQSSVAHQLHRITKLITDTKNKSAKKSISLGLKREIKEIERKIIDLRQGVFRFLVVGDVKRGKSTFINALIGENILPSNVTPCTAILTVLRHGLQKKVTVYFKDGTVPETIDFIGFKEKFTINKKKEKQLERQQKHAFSNINYAVVEYPLPFLEKGIEIVDSPGLNDTEANNELSLSYINNCQAILFVLRASQPFTLAERSYLENHIKDRGLSVFFLINAWDEIRESLIDPEDEQELAAAQETLHRLFHTNLAPYCLVEGDNLYKERVFPISSLLALRQRLKNVNSSLEGIGFPQFLTSLNTFLTQELGMAQLRPGITLAQQIHNRIHKANKRRITRIKKGVEELRQKNISVEPEFKQLCDIRDRYQQEIRDTRDRKARKITNSFSTYILNLGNTFEDDFLRYQPHLNFLDFLSKEKRQVFEAQLKAAFENYMSHKLTQWSKGAEKEIDTAFSQLAKSATVYGASYQKITNQITEKLTGQKLLPIDNYSNQDNSPTWTKWAAGLFSLARGNLAGVAMAGAGFDWKNIMINLIATLGIGTAITSFTGIALGPLSFALLGMGVSALQADQAKKQVIQATHKELLKYLPQIAKEQSPQIQKYVEQCFDIYENEVNKRLNDDIKNRESQLENLIKQKETWEINQQAELKLWQKLEADIAIAIKKMEKHYQGLLTNF